MQLIERTIIQSYKIVIIIIHKQFPKVNKAPLKYQRM